MDRDDHLAQLGAAEPAQHVHRVAEIKAMNAEQRAAFDAACSTLLDRLKELLEGVDPTTRVCPICGEQHDMQKPDCELATIMRKLMGKQPFSP